MKKRISKNEFRIQGYYNGQIESHIRTFDRCQNQWPWMTLNHRNKKLCRPPEKNLTKIGSYYQWQNVVSRNIKYLRILARYLGEGHQLSNKLSRPGRHCSSFGISTVGTTTSALSSPYYAGYISRNGWISNLRWWHIVSITAWRQRIWITLFRYQTYQVVAVSGHHLHSSCLICHIVWQPLAVARFLLQPQLSGILCLSMSSHHLLLQPFANGWRHCRFNSHFRTSSLICKSIGRVAMIWARLLKVLERPWIFFPDFQGLETVDSPWKPTWSLKVLESDFQKCHDRTSASRRLLRPWNMPRIRCRPGLRPDPTEGAHDAPPDPLVGWGGDTFSSRTPPPRRLRHLDSRAFTYPSYGPWKSLNLILTNGQEPCMRLGQLP